MNKCTPKKFKSHTQKEIHQQLQKAHAKLATAVTQTTKKPSKQRKTTHHKCATKIDKHAQTKNLWHMKNTSDVARLSLRNSQSYVDN